LKTEDVVAGGADPGLSFAPKHSIPGVGAPGYNEVRFVSSENFFQHLPHLADLA